MANTNLEKRVRARMMLSRETNQGLHITGMTNSVSGLVATVKPPIKDTPKEDKPLNKGLSKSTLAFTLRTK